MGDGRKDALRVNFDTRIKLEFHGAAVTSDAGLIAYRELDEGLELTEMGEVLCNSRRRRPGPLSLRRGNHHMPGGELGVEGFVLPWCVVGADDGIAVGAGGVGAGGMEQPVGKDHRAAARDFTNHLVGRVPSLIPNHFAEFSSSIFSIAATQ